MNSDGNIRQDNWIICCDHQGKDCEILLCTQKLGKKLEVPYWNTFMFTLLLWTDKKADLLQLLFHVHVCVWLMYYSVFVYIYTTHTHTHIQYSISLLSCYLFKVQAND
jgi:hypothetical protein